MSGKTFPATNLTIDDPTSAEIAPKGKFAVWASILSILFFSQIAYNIGEFPVSTAFICYALITLYLVTSGYASLSIPTLILYLIAGAFACLTMARTTSLASWTSLLLLSALYAPFSFRLKNASDLEPIQQYIERAYVSAATAISVIAVIQIVLVNVFDASYLTNVYFILPEEIRGAGSYTFFREGGGIVKANGFFLRESGALSIVIGLAMIIEYFTRVRWRILAILAAGLFCSFSGSGILALILGFLMPRSLNRVPHFLISSLVFILVFSALYSLEIPGLTIFFDRLSEFTTPGTSGYARFVAPMDMVQPSLDEGGATMWLGHGAGSYLRSTGLLGLKYEINDPTWAKLIYEYGLVGLTLISALFVARVYSSNLRPEICNFILFVWVSNGTLLSPDFAEVFWLLTLVPQAYRRSVPTGSAREPGKVFNVG
jgi:hypothetical protein